MFLLVCVKDNAHQLLHSLLEGVGMTLVVMGFICSVYKECANQVLIVHQSLKHA